MGSAFSVGESDALCEVFNGTFSAFTISDEALKKLSKPSLINTSNPASQILMIEMVKSMQADNYLKKMRCVQNQHSQKVGLTMLQMEYLVDSLAVFTRSVNDVAPELEKELVESVKKDCKILNSEDAVNKYVKKINEEAIKVAEKNCKGKIDTSIFS